MTHYRQPIDFTNRGLEEAKNILDGWYRAIENVDDSGEMQDSFVSELVDDLNTPQALAVLHQLKSEVSSGTFGKCKQFKSMQSAAGYTSTKQ